MPSISSRSMPTSGSGRWSRRVESRVVDGTTVGMGPVHRAATLRRCSSSSTSTASSTAAPTPVPGVAAVLAARAAPRRRRRLRDEQLDVLPGRLRDRGWPRWARRSARIGSSAHRGRPRSTCASTTRGLAASWPWAARGLDGSSRTSASRSSRPADAAARVEAEGIDGYEAAGRPDAVVVGLDPDVTTAGSPWPPTASARGARFVATNRDPIYPTETRPAARRRLDRRGHRDGRRRSPAISIGKPEPLLLLEAAARGRRRTRRRGDDRRRDRDRPRGRPGRRRALHPDADRRHDPGRARGAARGRATDGRRRRRRGAGGDPGRARPAADAGRAQAAQPGAPSSGTTAAQASNSARSGARTSTARRRPRRAPAGRSPRARQAQPDPLDGPRVLLGQVDVGRRSRSSVESVTGTPARGGGRADASATDGTMPAWTLLVGHRSRVDAAVDQLGHERRVVDRDGPWAIRSGSRASARRTWAAPPHSPAWR